MPSVQPLGLPDVDVVDMHRNHDLLYLKVVLVQQQVLSACPTCHGRMHWHDERNLNRIADTPSEGLRVRLNVQRRRSICAGTCGTLVPPVTPFVDEERRVTKRLLAYLDRVFRQLDRRFDSVAKEVGLSERSARRLFGSIMECALATQHLQPVLGRTLEIAELTLAGKPRLALVNVEEEALADLLDDASAATLRDALVRLMPPGKPHYVQIPAREDVRDVVRRLFPNARVSLSLAAARNAHQEVMRKLPTRTTEPAVREAGVRAAATLLQPYEVRAGSPLQDVRAALKRVQTDLHPGVAERVPWLQAWVGTWENELITAQLQPLDDAVRQSRVSRNVQQAGKKLVQAGNGYAWDMLRQRLLLHHGQLPTYRLPRNSSAYATSARDPYALTTLPMGRPVGTFGVPLGALLAALDLAILDVPPGLPELPLPDDD